MTDPVTAPGHYTRSSIQPLDFIRATLTPEEFRGWVKGTVIKYVARAGYKDGEPMERDIGKAVFYLRLLLGEDPREPGQGWKRVRPFRDEVEYQWWLESNCEQCRRHGAEGGCEIENALSEASSGNGEVSDEIWDWMGRDSWECTARVPLGEGQRD